MKFVLFVIFGVGLAIGEPISLNYHETIGIKMAAAIKAAEEAPATNIQKLIYRGSKVRLGQYPYFGGLVISLTDGRSSYCGASLLTNTRLVTAAHCWWDGSHQAYQFEVVLGSTKLYSGGKRVITNDVEIHEDYNPSASQANNDIAMIRLQDPVDFSRYISNVALPWGSLVTSDFVGLQTRAAGFGVTSDYFSNSSPTLNHIYLSVIRNSECATVYNVVDSTIICTDGSDGPNICRGDSGGPLVVCIEGQDVLIGISLFTFRYGCERRQPAGYTRVTSFLPWILPRLIN